jgi:hypothetical protein
MRYLAIQAGANHQDAKVRVLRIIHHIHRTARMRTHGSVCCWLQEQRNILALAVGLKGIAAIRAVLNWAPVQAHATSHRVTAYYVTKSPQTAAFLAEWDQWREAGVSNAGETCGSLPVKKHTPKWFLCFSARD